MATATMSASKDPVDAAIEAVLKRLKVTIALKSEQQVALKAFIQIFSITRLNG